MLLAVTTKSLWGPKNAQYFDSDIKKKVDFTDKSLVQARIVGW